MPGQTRNKPTERPDRRDRSARTTANILRVLRSAKTPMSAYELLAALRGDRINAPTTVYRALAQLIKDGVIHRVESLGAYVVCERATHRHGPTAFAICSDCGRVNELPSEEVVRRLRRSATRAGFQVEATMIELTGSCAACARQ